MAENWIVSLCLLISVLSLAPKPASADAGASDCTRGDPTETEIALCRLDAKHRILDAKREILDARQQISALARIKVKQAVVVRRRSNESHIGSCPVDEARKKLCDAFGPIRHSCDGQESCSVTFNHSLCALTAPPREYSLTICYQCGCGKEEESTYVVEARYGFDASLICKSINACQP